MKREKKLTQLQKQTILHRVKNVNIIEMHKNESARANRAKLLFFIFKYANL